MPLHHVLDIEGHGCHPVPDFCAVHPSSDEGAVGLWEQTIEVRRRAGTRMSRRANDENAGHEHEEQHDATRGTETDRSIHHSGHARTLLDRDALREVARLIHVGTSQPRHVIGQQLQRDRHHHR
jgi:hypothetical protein